MADELPVLRIARHADDLERIVNLYVQGLGCRVLSSFTGHHGFDGVILGHPQAPYHLEFTRQAGHSAGIAPEQGPLLVFYHPDPSDWDVACGRMRKAGFADAVNENPYWEAHGKTFVDPEGWRIVLANQDWGK